MSAVAAGDAEPMKEYAAEIAEHFRSYNDEFGRITRRAALNFLADALQQALDPTRMRSSQGSN